MRGCPDARAPARRRLRSGDVKGYRAVVSVTAAPPIVGGGLRWLRALVLSVTAWSIASGAHLAAGGALPPMPVLLAVVALSAWVLTFALGSQASGPWLVGLLALEQLAMHVTLVASSAWTHAPSASLAGPALATGHVHPVGPGAVPVPTGAVAGTMLSSAAATGGTHAMAWVPSAGMLLAHALAAVVLGCLLARGERLLFGLLGLLAQLARPALRICRLALCPAPAVPAGARLRVRLAAALAGPDQRWRTDRPLARVITRRGPPVAAV